MVDLEKLDATHAKLTCGLITEVAERFPDEVMNSRDAHTLSDVVAELAALRALAEVVQARCDMANPGWAPEIREAWAAVEKVKTP